MANTQRGGRGAGNVMWGICTNTNGYDHEGEHRKCSKCMNKEKQAIRAGRDFVCEECQMPLTKTTPPPQTNMKLIIIIAAAVVVIGGGIGAWLGLSGGDKKAQEEAARLDSIRVADSIRQAAIADSIAAAAAEDEAARQAAIADSIRIADSIAAASKAAQTQPSATPRVTSGGARLPYGSYNGPMQGGKPHGVGGTINVSSSYQLDLKDGRGSTLDLRPGDKIANTKFENGRLRSGELQRTDGTRKWFNC